MGSRFEKAAVQGTAVDGSRVWSTRFTLPVAAFTLYTSAEDYGRFLAGVLNDKEVLGLLLSSPILVDQRINSVSWGLGWGIEKRGDDTLIWHWGNNPGYRAFVMASVSSGNGVVILTNSENGMALAEPITRNVLPGVHSLFRMPMLRDGLTYFLCDAVDICL